MKTMLALSILLCTLASHLRAETATSTIETDIDVMKTDIRNLNERIDTFEKNVNTRFETFEKNVNARFESLEKNFDRLNNIIIACIGIPLAILAIGATVWGILAHRRSRKEQTLEQQIETLTQEIETLKERQIITP